MAHIIRKHRITQNFFYYNLPIIFLCFSVYSVGSSIKEEK